VWESDKQGELGARNRREITLFSGRILKPSNFPALLQKYGKTETLTVIYSNAYIV